MTPAVFGVRNRVARFGQPRRAMPRMCVGVDRLADTIGPPGLGADDSQARGTIRTKGIRWPTARKSAFDPSTEKPNTRGRTNFAAARCRDAYSTKISAPPSSVSGTAVTGIVRRPTTMLTSGVCRMLRYQAAFDPHPDATI